MFKTNKDHLAVWIEKQHEDTMGRFAIDPYYNPTWNVREYGTVVATPTWIRPEWNMPIDFFKEGDRVYFDFDAIENATSFKHDDGETYHLIPYRDIYARVRDGKVTPRSGKIICKPYYGDDAEQVDVDGVKTWVRMKGNLVVSTDVKPSERIAIVDSIGSNLTFEPELDLKEGDMVYRDEHTNLEYTVEGEKVYIIDQQLILAKKI